MVLVKTRYMFFKFTILRNNMDSAYVFFPCAHDNVNAIKINRTGILCKDPCTNDIKNLESVFVFKTYLPNLMSSTAC